MNSIQNRFGTLQVSDKRAPSTPQMTPKPDKKRTVSKSPQAALSSRNNAKAT